MLPLASSCPLHRSYVTLKRSEYPADAHPPWLWDASRASSSSGSSGAAGSGLFFVSHAFGNGIDLILDRLEERFLEGEHDRSEVFGACFPVPSHWWEDTHADAALLQSRDLITACRFGDW